MIGIIESYSIRILLKRKKRERIKIRLGEKIKWNVSNFESIEQLQRDIERQGLLQLLLD